MSNLGHIITSQQIIVLYRSV